MTVATTQPEIVLVGSHAARAGAPVAALPELPPNVFTPSSSSQALALLRREGKSAQSPPPAVVLLDLAAQGAQAWKFLRRLKSDSALRRVPVIIVGGSASNGSASNKDRARAYELRANSYVPSHQGRQLETVLARVQDFWLTKVRLPSG
jgi:CheY-like chemotaxis protein